MQLTSYERMRRYISDANGSILADNAKNKRDLLSIIGGVSATIEKELRRETHIEERTKYLDMEYERREYFLPAYPVMSISMVSIDLDAKFDSTTYELTTDEYAIGCDSNSLIIMEPPNLQYENRSMKVVYTGGLAYDPVKSIFAVGSVSGVFTEGTYAIGQTTYAVGLVRSVSGTAYTTEVLYGIFEVGETIKNHTLEDGSDTSSTSAVILSKTQTALCEAYPDLALAAEMQVRLYWSHKYDFEYSNFTKDSSTKRMTSESGLLPEVEDKLQPFKNYA